MQRAELALQQEFEAKQAFELKKEMERRKAANVGPLKSETSNQHHHRKSSRSPPPKGRARPNRSATPRDKKRLKPSDSGEVVRLRKEVEDLKKTIRSYAFPSSSSSDSTKHRPNKPSYGDNRTAAQATQDSIRRAGQAVAALTDTLDEENRAHAARVQLIRDQLAHWREVMRGLRTSQAKNASR